MKLRLHMTVAALAIASAFTAPSIAQDAQLGDWGVETANIDPAIDPGDDFFRHVNEGWLERTDIPEGFPANGAFLELYLLSEERVADIISDMGVTGGAPGTPSQQVGDLYSSFMNTGRIDQLGLDPLRADIERLQAIETPAEIAAAFATPYAPSFVTEYVGVNSDDPDHYILNLTQSGLGMPGRDYYLRDDDDFRSYQDAYRTHLANVFALAGMDNGAERAQRIYDFEAALAEIHWVPADAQDSLLTHNRMSRGELIDYAPGFDWAAYLAARGLGDIENLNVDETTALRDMAAVIAATPVETLRDYLTVHYIDNHAALLPDAFYQENFDFHARTLNGVANPRARELRAVQLVNGNLGELVGQIYVERHFPPEYKAQMEELVAYLRRGLRERIQTLEWMDDETRVEALRKLDAFGVKIGYPDQWHDYSSIRIDAGDLIGNMHRIAEYDWNEDLERLRGPVRDWEWGMNPQTVNAYYSSTRNEIVFPAAILQPPFFDPHADAAVNFGGIGGVIGHEMGHGFDDDGSRYNADGFLRNWWTDEARANFEQRTDMLVAQYDAFEPLEGIHVDGNLTLGENIGDVGGLSMALRSYRLYAADHPETNRMIDGYTPEQRFFLSWAQVWRFMSTDGYTRNLVLTDEHSPAQYRVNGVVRNLDDWYDAFGITEDDALYLPPEERVNIW